MRFECFAIERVINDGLFVYDKQKYRTKSAGHRNLCVLPELFVIEMTNSSNSLNSGSIRCCPEIFGLVNNQYLWGFGKGAGNLFICL